MFISLNPKKKNLKFAGSHVYEDKKDHLESLIRLLFLSYVSFMTNELLAQLLSFKLKLCLCDHLLSNIPPSVRLSVCSPSVNIGGTNLDRVRVSI